MEKETSKRLGSLKNVSRQTVDWFGIRRRVKRKGVLYILFRVTDVETGNHPKGK